VAADAVVADLAALAGLVGDIGRAPAVELVRLFVETAPRHLEALRALAGRDQHSELIRQAHTLANTARSLGLPQVARACRDLEDEASADGPSPALDRLAVLLEQGTAILREWLSQAAEPR